MTSLKWKKLTQFIFVAPPMPTAENDKEVKKQHVDLGWWAIEAVLGNTLIRTDWLNLSEKYDGS